MLGSIFVGLGGMNAFSSALRQISNNITNLNSNGFKASLPRFVDLSGRGQETGEGVELSEGRLDFNQGELRQTNSDLDLAVDGEGFLLLLSESGEQFLTRTGSFEVQDDGDIVLSGSEHGLAMLSDGALTAASIAAHKNSPPKQTTRVTFSDNLSSSASSAYTVSNIKLFNPTGDSTTWSAKFERVTGGAPGEWKVTVTDGAGEVGAQTLKFIAGVVDPSTNQLTFEKDGYDVTFDFSTGVNSFSSGDVSTLRVAKTDGHGLGEITGVTVTEEGKLQVAYSNAEKTILGDVALVRVRDLATLDQRDSGLWSQPSSARLEALTAAHDTVGRIVGRRLEASNVDLSKQFGELILVQRGYQASSQVVSVSNDMIQQLFGIRGQG